MTHDFAIERGEKPAQTIRQLVNAQRQNFAGAGADLHTIYTLLDRGEYGDDLLNAVNRLAGHLRNADRKATLAFEAANSQPQARE